MDPSPDHVYTKLGMYLGRIFWSADPSPWSHHPMSVRYLLLYPAPSTRSSELFAWILCIHSIQYITQRWKTCVVVWYVGQFTSQNVRTLNEGSWRQPRCFTRIARCEADEVDFKNYQSETDAEGASIMCNVLLSRRTRGTMMLSLQEGDTKEFFRLGRLNFSRVVSWGRGNFLTVDAL